MVRYNPNMYYCYETIEDFTDHDWNHIKKNLKLFGLHEQLDIFRIYISASGKHLTNTRKIEFNSPYKHFGKKRYFFVQTYTDGKMKGIERLKKL